MIQLAFDKQEITTELGMSANEKNVRILDRMKQVFMGNFRYINSSNNILIENCPINCYSEGRGKTLKFIVEMEEELLPYFNLKLWLMQNCDFRSDFDYELVLRHLHLIQNNQEFTTLNEIAEGLDCDISMIQRHRDKMNNKIFATKDYCKRCVYDREGQEISLELYESIEYTFNNAWKKIVELYPKQQTIELYVKFSDDLEGDWHIVSCLDENYDLIVESLENKGYVCLECGLLYKDGKVNKYLKDKSHLYHLQINGIADFTYFRTLYQLTEKMKKDEEFNDLVHKAYSLLQN